MYRSCLIMSRRARSWAGVILTGSAGGSGRAGSGAGLGALEAARAREPVLGRPLRRAPSWVASACFCFRAGGLSALGPGAPRPSVAPAQVAEEAALQQALPQALQQALQRQEPTAQPEASPRGAPHCRPFPRLNILILVIQENRKRNTGPTGVNRVAVDIRQLKAQCA